MKLNAYFPYNPAILLLDNYSNEMKTYVYADGTANGLRGTHDDCVIASALAIQGIKSGINYLW